MKHIAVVLLLCFCASCSSINRQSEIKSAKLEYGVATKSDVVNAIGLPNKIEKKDGNEYWIYSGKETRSNFFIPLPVAATPSGGGVYNVYYTDIGPKFDVNFDPAYICIFNNQSVLIGSFDPRTK